MRPTVEKFLHWLDVSCPDFIWFARPCTIESSLQELSMSPTRAGRGRQDAVMADREYQEVTSLRIWSARGYQKQIEKKRHAAAIEQPKEAKSWKTNKTLSTLDGYDCDLDSGPMPVRRHTSR